MSDDLKQAVDLLRRCNAGFGAFINGRKLKRKEREALRSDIESFLFGRKSTTQSTGEQA